MITCVGSLAFDTTATPAGRAVEEPGGSGAYFSLAAALLSKVSLVSAVGGDFPKGFLEGMAARNVDVSGVRVENGAKTMRYGSTFLDDFNIRRQDFTQLNVFERFDPQISRAQAKNPFLYLGTLTPAIQLSVIRQMENPEFVAMDTIEYFIKNDFDGVKRVLAQVGCAILNDAEARMLTRRQNLVAAGGELLRMGPSMAVIKKGEHGSILFLQDGTVSPYPAFPLESVVDPTGAGDAFAGGFVGFLSRAGSVRRESLRKAMAWGTVAGSITVESFGTKPLMEATFETALERYEKYRALMHYEEEK